MLLTYTKNNNMKFSYNLESEKNVKHFNSTTWIVADFQLLNLKQIFRYPSMIYVYRILVLWAILYHEIFTKSKESYPTITFFAGLQKLLITDLNMLSSTQSFLPSFSITLKACYKKLITAHNTHYQ